MEVVFSTPFFEIFFCQGFKGVPVLFALIEWIALL